MSIQTRIKGTLHALSRTLTSAMAHSHYSTTRGDCPHCAANTAWAMRPLNGYHRCLQCGNDPFDAAHSSQ